MTVTLTEKAAFRLRTFLKASGGQNQGVRLAAHDGGCSGYEYALDLVSEPAPEDRVFEQDKVRIFIDPQSDRLLDGVEIDFVESLTQSGFTFSNPNAISTCGCGKSFSVADCSPGAVPCS